MKPVTGAPALGLTSHLTYVVFVSASIVINGCICVASIPNSDTSPILNVIQVLRWNNVIALFDHAHSNVIQLLLPELPMTTIYDLDDLEKSDKVRQLLQQLYQEFFPKLHFLLLSDFSRAIELLQIVDHFDQRSNRTTDFRHFSYWIVACYSWCQPESSVLPPIQHLENVALISLRGGVLNQLLTTAEGRSFSSEISIERIRTFQDIFPNTQYGLNNRRLLVSTVPREAFVIKNGKKFEGYFIDILDSMAKSLNFSYKMVYPSDMKLGEVADGRWDGIVGQLEKREVDMVISTLTIHQDREKVMDFLYPPIVSLFDDIVYRLPSEDEERWMIFLGPFHPFVLLILLITLLSSSVIGYLLRRHDGMFNGLEHGHNNWKHMLCGIPYTFLHLLGILLLKGTGDNIRTDSSRLYLFTWALFSLILSACYSANLVSVFTVQRPEIPFSNIHDLVRQSDYKWGLLGGDLREHIFKSSRTGDMKLFWEGVLKFNETDQEVLSEKDWIHLNKVRSEKYAFVSTRYFINRVRSEDCSVRAVDQDIIWHQCGIGVPTGYPLSRELEAILVSLADSGLLDNWWQKWTHINTDHCIEDRSKQTLTLPDIVSVFYPLCVGLGSAGVALLIEHISHKIAEQSADSTRKHTRINIKVHQ